MQGRIFSLVSMEEEKMETVGQPYTLGLWTAKAGKEKMFIAEWKAFSAWTAEHQPGAKKGYLLQDSRNPQQFISFGPWENAEVINAWRESPEFRDFGMKVRELCDEFQPRSLLLVATSD
jgi:heme-degrading monooxygenase HmoA